MPSEQARERAFDYFQSGFHCAESIARAIVELHGSGVEGKEVQRFAAAFMGGIGGTHEDTCGALTGGVVAIGCLRGRREAGQDDQEVKDLAAEFRSRFVGQFGSSRCCVILERLSERDDGFGCKELTAVAAELLSDLLTERSISR